MSPKPSQDMERIVRVPICLSEIKLGRIVQSASDPFSSFVDPDLDPEKLKKLTSTTAIEHLNATDNFTGKKSIGGSFMKILSSLGSTAKGRDAILMSSHAERVKLGNIPQIYEEAIKQEAVRNWVQKTYKSQYGRYGVRLSRSTKVYMITGYTVVRGLELSVRRKIQTSGSGTVDVGSALNTTPVLSAAPTVVTPIQITAEKNRNSSADTRFPGEIIYALWLQKIRLRAHWRGEKLEPTLEMTEKWKTPLEFENIFGVKNAEDGDTVVGFDGETTITEEMDDQVAFFKEFNQQLEMTNGRHALGVQSSGGGGWGGEIQKTGLESDEVLDVLAELEFGDSGSDTDEDEETSSEDEEEQAYTQIRDYDGAERSVISVGQEGDTTVCEANNEV